MYEMYTTLIMRKPGASFGVDDLERLIREVAASGEAAVTRAGGSFSLTQGDAMLKIDWNNLPHVVEESDEIAERFKIPCHGCPARFEMNGDDPDMDLFNDYLLINERLQATGQFVIFDSQECKLLFDEE